MGGQYDSILKEKKKYIEESDPKDKNSFGICFFIDILLIIIILLISYLIYYRSVLNIKNIVVNDNKVLLSKYQYFFKYLYLDDILSNGTLEGELVLNDYNYKFNISRLDDVMSINLDNGSDKINYYYGNDKTFYQIASIGDNYVSSLGYNKYKGVSELSDNFVNKINGSKKFYFNDNNPTVEVNMSLSSDDIKGILFDLFKDKYEVILTIKNSAFSNDILSEKIVLNNQSKDIRWVLLYKNGNWVITNKDGKNIKYDLNINKKMLKIFHDDELYSVLKYSNEGDKYIYSYQVINEIYTLDLAVTKLNNHYIYEFDSNIDNNKDHFVIECDKSTSNNIDTINPLVDNSISRDELKKYRDSENVIIDPLRNFVSKYREGFNSINNY